MVAPRSTAGAEEPRSSDQVHYVTRSNSYLTTKVMPSGHVEERAHPDRALLLYMAFHNGAAIAEIDRHLAAFLNQRGGDRLPPDRDRGQPCGGDRGRCWSAEVAQEAGIIEHALQLVLQALLS